MYICSLNDELQLERGALPGKPVRKDGGRVIDAVPGLRMQKTKGHYIKEKEEVFVNNYEMFKDGSGNVVIGTTYDQKSGELHDVTGIVGVIPAKVFKKLDNAFAQGYSDSQMEALIDREFKNRFPSLITRKLISNIIKKFFANARGNSQLIDIPDAPLDPADVSLGKTGVFKYRKEA